MWRPKYWRTAESNLEQAESSSQFGGHCALHSGEKSCSTLKIVMSLSLTSFITLKRCLIPNPENGWEFAKLRSRGRDLQPRAWTNPRHCVPVVCHVLLWNALTTAQSSSAQPILPAMHGLILLSDTTMGNMLASLAWDIQGWSPRCEQKEHGAEHCASLAA